MDEIFLDLRGLMPPEPMERVLDAIADMRPGQRVRMLIDREPRPLYRILERNRHPYEPTLRPDGLYEIVIHPAA